MKFIDKMLFALGLTGIGLGAGIAISKFEKEKEIVDLLQEYSVEAKQIGSFICGDKLRELGDYCQREYFDAPLARLILDYTRPDFKWVCEQTLEHPDFSRDEFEVFLKQLDADKNLRSKIEVEMYSSEREVFMYIKKNGKGEYTIDVHKDTSDFIFGKYLEKMRSDRRVQEIFENAKKGKENYTQLSSELERVVKGSTAADDLEKRVQMEILKEIGGYEFNKYLADEDELRNLRKELFEKNGKIWVQLIGHDFNIKLLIEAHRLEYERTVEGEKREKIAEELKRLTEKRERIQQEKEKYGKELEKTQKESAEEEVFEMLNEDLINRRVMYALDSQKVLAVAHTHPFSEDSSEYAEEELGPSKTDVRTGMFHMQVVFAALPNKWKVYSTVCGETKVEREYQLEN